MKRHAFLVGEAIMSIYPTDDDGNAVTDNPILLNAEAEGITVHEALEEIIDRPTGSEYPEPHHGAEEHGFEIQRVWEPMVSEESAPAQLGVTPAIPTNELINGQDYRLTPGMRYVVVLAWHDESQQDSWIYRTYYGVTDRSHDLRGSRVDEIFASSLAFRAQYYLSATSE